MAVASQRHNNFDLLRLVAASQVVWDHATTHLGLATPTYLALILHAFPGVPIFFVISGFLISMSYERNYRAGATKQYYVNRVLRIYPALWIAFGIGIVTVAIFGSPSLYGASLRQLLRWTLAQVTVAQVFNPGFLRHYGTGALNGSLWTIPVELEFYVVLPVLYAVLRLHEKRRTKRLIATIVVALGLNLYFTHVSANVAAATTYKLVKYSLLPYLYVFLLGVILQRSMTAVRSLLEGKALAWLAVYALTCLVVARFGMASAGNLLPIPLMLVLAPTVVSCAYSVRRLGHALLRGRDLSYGTYLYHMLVVNVLVELGWRGRHDWRAALLVFAVVYVVAFLSWTFIERPALSLRQYLPTRAPDGIADAV